MRRPVSATLSEEQPLLDIVWTEGTSGKRKVTRNKLIDAFDADYSPQSTSWMTSPLELARSWNPSVPKNTGTTFPALLSVYKSRTAFSREATSTPSRRRSKDRSSSTCSTRAQLQTTNSTVRRQSPAIIGYPDVQGVASSLDQGIPALTSAFAARFKSVFPIPPANQSTEKFSQAITSNLLGGIGYFYGSSIEDRGFAYEWDDEEGETEGKESKGPKLTDPRELLTATPSRSFFPRGFYWCVC